MKLRASNQRIEMPGEDVVRVLREIELVLVSLHRIGAHYASSLPGQIADYEHETTRFIDEWKVADRLALARRILSNHFDTEIGDDDLDDLEREMHAVNYWSNPQSSAKDGAE